MSQGFGGMRLSRINRANSLLSLTVMCLECLTHRFYENAFKFMPLTCSINYTQDICFTM